MKIHTFNELAYVGGGNIPVGRYVACGIAPGSDVDICTVGGNRLGPMSLVPCSPGSEVKPIRGYRTSDGYFLFTSTSQDTVGSSLSLLLYEPEDPLVPPGPRAPAIYAESYAFAVGETRKVFRFPMMGRKNAAIRVQRLGGENPNVTITVRGVSFHSAAQMRRGSLASESVSVLDEEVYYSWDTVGAASRPASTINGADKLGKTIYIGGAAAEFFDEVDVFLDIAAQVNPTYFSVQAEVTGERV